MEKTVPNANDLLIIEDSAVPGARKKLKLSNLFNSGIPNFFGGRVVERNIDIEHAGFEPENGTIIYVLPDYDIALDTTEITMTINGADTIPLFEYYEHEQQYVIELLYFEEKWFVLSLQEELSISGEQSLRLDSLGNQWLIILEGIENDTVWLDKATSGLGVETDPTVYPWAKAILKPEYAWSEINSKPVFATVSTTGSYNDLLNQPTIPTNTNQLTNGALFITDAASDGFYYARRNGTWVLSPSGADGNSYPTSLAFVGGNLTLGRYGLTDLVVSLDGRYLQSEVDGSVTNEIQNLGYAPSTRTVTIDGTGSADVVLPLFSSTEAGLVPLSGGGTANFLRADGAWAPATSSSGYTDPLTTRGDILYRNATVTTRLPIGANTYVLTSNGTDPVWQPSASGADGNNYPTSIGWNAGIITIGRNGLSNLFVSIDGRYLQSEVDGSISNEGVLGVLNPVAGTAQIKSNTSGTTGVSLVAGTNMSFDVITSLDGGQITLNSTGTSLPLATNSTRGGIQIGYTPTANNFALQLSSEKAFVTVPNATSTIKGIASFSSANFSVSSGHVSIVNAGISYNHLANGTISGLSEINSGITNTDEIMLSYGGMLRKTDVSVLGDYLQTYLNSITGTGSAGKVAFYSDASTITYDTDYGYNATSNTLTVGSGLGNGSVTSGNFILSSDRRLKAAIQPINNINWVDDIHFKSFVMKNDLTGRLRFGVVAQEVEKVNPNLVFTDENGFKAVGYTDLLIAKVARQDEIINELIKRIENLENEK